MDRSEEFWKICRIYNPALIDANIAATANEAVSSDRIRSSGFLQTALKIANNAESNGTLITRMEALSNRKEFSNDPSQEMADMSDLFQRKVAVIKRDMDHLKAMSQDHHSSSNGQLLQSKQQLQHYDLMVQTLNKQLSKHVSSFQTVLKAHTEHVKQRQQRVAKYGQQQQSHLDTVNTSSLATQQQSNNQNYALFGGNAPAASNLVVQELRRRGVAAAQSGSSSQHSAGNMASTNHQISNSSSNSNSSNYGQQAQISAPPVHSFHRKDQRLRNAEKVESTIMQMGQLFQQMTTLIMEQSETISRIEDDVELGLHETTEAHKSMETFYDITKGNRGLIIKIFALLIFFIFLFLVWT